MESVGTHCVVALFASQQDAERAVLALRDAGVERSDISVVARDEESAAGRKGARRSKQKSGNGTSIGENIAGGAVFGALGGLLLELAALAIPGIGPIIAAGPLATTLAGAGIGAVGGGIVGAIKEMGVPAREANLYAESIKRGDTLVSVSTDASKIDTVSAVLNTHGAVDVEDRASSLRESGWTEFNETANQEPDEYEWPSSAPVTETARPKARTYERQR